MTSQLLVRAGRAGGGLLATRDYPNILLPTRNEPLVPTLGHNWTLGAWTTVTTGLAYNCQLDQLHAQSGIGATIAGDGVTEQVEIIEMDMFNWALATGAGHTIVATALDAGGVIAVLSGDPNPPPVGVQAQLWALQTVGLDVAPGTAVAAGTPIALAAGCSGAPVSPLVRCYVSLYDLTSPGLVSPPKFSKALMLGQTTATPGPLLPLATVSITTGSSIWALPASWTEVVHSLDKDCLIWGLAVLTTVPPGQEPPCQIELGLGAADASTVIQQRYGCPFYRYYHGVACIQRRLPFIAYAGERLVARCAGSLANTAYKIMPWGVKLG